MKVLVIDDEPILRQVSTLLLQSKFYANVIEAHNGLEGIKNIQLHPDLDLIICDYNMPEASGGAVFKYIKENSIKIPFVLCSTDSPEDHHEFDGYELTGFVQKPHITSQLYRIVDSLIQSSHLHLKERAYCRISTDSLLKIDTLHADLHIRLSKTKYLKSLNKGDVFSFDDYERLKKRGVHELYVKTHDAQVFLENFIISLLTTKPIPASALTNEMIKNTINTIKDENLRRDLLHLADYIKDAQETNPTQEDIFILTQAAHETLQDTLQAIGISNETGTLIKATVSLVVRTINESASLSELFLKNMEQTSEYVHHHSILLAYIACGIANQLGWFSDLTRYKLSMAAFMHDISLDDEKLARLQTITELNEMRSRLTVSEIRAFENHSVDAANIIQQINELPLELDMIVRQHHERPDGTGFPEGITYQKISPLSAILIVAHDIINFMSQHGESTLNVKEFLKAHQQDYQFGTFKKIYSALLDN